ncbi:MAG: hypothetical protein KAH32_05940, partial [Chlamydiia bacterium]|nr:hypothetical protein [Chlamydiia bacterium]
SEEQTLFDEKLDNDGKAKVDAELEINNASPGMLKASFMVRAFEESGDFSIDRFSIPYSPYKAYVGMKLPKGDKARGMLLTDEKHKIDIVTLDSDGKPVNRKVKVEIYKISWRWWWQKNGDDDLSKYVGNSYYTPLSTKYVTTKNGKGSSVLEIKYPDWGRYLVHVSDENGGHATGKIIYVDWPGWAGRAVKDNPGGASMLTFATDKADYIVGETVNVTFPSSGKGRALVSIENGSKIVNSFWVSTQDKSTKFDFTVTPEMTPNVYINITLVQPHNYKENDLPIRLYGIVPIKVVDPETKLEPQLTMPDKIRPGEKVNIKVKEAQGRKMNYTIAVVD